MNIYEEIGVKRIINAGGRITKLGASTISDTVAKAAADAAQHYVSIDELMMRAGEIISSYTGAEDSCPTSCASAGICLSVAGVITKGIKKLVEQLPDSEGLANEIILQKGHVIGFGAPMTTMIRLAGGVPVEVGQATKTTREDIEENISDRTAALMYVKSHHCVQKGMLGIEEVADIAHAHGLPLIVDAAAEEDLRRYINIGADLVIYSGAKAIEATTSGFVTGKRELIDYVRKQYNGIGRPMKVRGRQNACGNGNGNGNTNANGGERDDTCWRAARRSRPMRAQRREAPRAAGWPPGGRWSSGCAPALRQSGPSSRACPRARSHTQGSCAPLA